MEPRRGACLQVPLFIYIFEIMKRQFGFTLMFILGITLSLLGCANTDRTQNYEICFVVDDVGTPDVLSTESTYEVISKVSIASTVSKTDERETLDIVIYPLANELKETATNAKPYTYAALTSVKPKLSIKGGVLDTQLKILTLDLIVDARTVSDTDMNLRGFICSFNKFETHTA